MQREILFRGKRKDGKGWVYGVPIYNPYVSGVEIASYEEIAPSLSDPGGDLRYNHNEVDPATIGQFTGWTDKNDKRIFEGDLMDYGVGRVVQVVFFDGKFTAKFADGSMNYLINMQILPIIGNACEQEEEIESARADAFMQDYLDAQRESDANPY